MKHPCSTVALSLFALLALAQPAFADGNGAPRQESGKADLVSEAEQWLSRAAAGPTAASEPTEHGGTNREGARTAEREPLSPEATGTEQRKPFFDLAAPTASVVARDWHGSLRIMGDHTLVLDDLRATASNRMVMGRLATDSRMSTFVQVGLGQWRIDPAMFPTARSYSEMAGQVGSGVELRLSSRVRIASEVTYTALYHDLHYTSDEVAPRILAFAVAIDGRF
jgi:hypothetical protein